MKILENIWVRAWINSSTRMLAIVTSVVIAVALIVGTSMWAFAGRASAEFIGDGQYVRGVGAENSHGFWLGALATAQNLGTDEPSYCVSMWAHSPKMTMPASASVLEAPTVSAPAELVLTPAQMAYVMTNYHAENSAYSRAALAFLAHVNFEQKFQGRNTAESVQRLYAVVREQKPQVYELAVEYVNRARAFAPISYEAGELSVQGFSGALEGVGARSATGWAAGIPIEVSLEGPGVFEENGATRWVGVTGGEPLSLPWRVLDDGEISATVTFPQTARQTLTVATVGGQYQDLLTLAMRPESDPISRTMRVNPVHVNAHFQPQIHTNVGAAMIVDFEKGRARVADDVEVSLPGDQVWPTVQGQGAEVVLQGRVYSLNSPIADGIESIPAEAKPLADVELRVNASGSYHAEVDVDHVGFVTWVWSIRRDNLAHQVMTDQGKTIADMLRSDWQDRYGLLAESSSIRYQVEVDSALSLRETRSGTYLVDDLYVKGMPADHGEFNGLGEFSEDAMTMRQDLFFFPRGLEVSEENLDQARLIGGVDIPARGGFHPSVGDTAFRVLEGNPVGVYVFVTSFAGDSRVAPFRSLITDEHEWFVVTPPPEVEIPEVEVPQSFPPEPPMPPAPPADPVPPAPPVNQTPPTPPAQPDPPTPLVPDEPLDALPTPLAHTGVDLSVLSLGLSALLLGVGMTLYVRKGVNTM